MNSLFPALVLILAFAALAVHSKVAPSEIFIDMGAQDFRLASAK
jgi:hypothetical protein